MLAPAVKLEEGWLHSSKPKLEETGSASTLDQVQSNANSDIGFLVHAKENPSDSMPSLQPKLGALKDTTNSEPKENKDKAVSISDFQDRCLPGGKDSIIVYTTTLRGIRKTFEDCNTIRFLLDSFRVMYSERDISMHLEYREELWRILGSRVVPPRLFIRGRYIGGADEVVELHERGMLQNLLEGIPLSPSNRPCKGCAGMRFLLCPNCNGSRKVMPEEQNKTPSIRCPDFSNDFSHTLPSFSKSIECAEAHHPCPILALEIDDKQMASCQTIGLHKKGVNKAHAREATESPNSVPAGNKVGIHRKKDPNVNKDER